MDDARFSSLTSIVLAFGLTLSLTGHAVDLEYIGPNRRAELEKEFHSAKLPPAKMPASRWSCDMYGMRTHLQVKRGVRLYDWDKNGRNNGAQVASEYLAEDGSLVGRTSRFEDRVRLSDSGELISELRLREPNPRVVAYSVCRASDS